MTTNPYITIIVTLNIIGLISFYFMTLSSRKRREIKFTAIVKRITSVRTKDEFEQVFRRLAKNEIRTLSGRQKNEIFSLKDILEANLI